MRGNVQDLYNRLLAKGNTRMQARCAVMRKMLLILRGMVKNDQKFRVLNEKSRKMWRNRLTFSKPSPELYGRSGSAPPLLRTITINQPFQMCA